MALELNLLKYPLVFTVLTSQHLWTFRLMRNNGQVLKRKPLTKPKHTKFSQKVTNMQVTS